MLIVEYCRFGNLQQFLIKSRNNFINQVDEFGQLKILESVTDGKGFYKKRVIKFLLIFWPSDDETLSTVILCVYKKLNNNNYKIF